MSDPSSPPALLSPEHAVIYVGAASVSMIISQRGADRGQFTPVEHLDRPLPLARDTFRNGSITRATVEQAVGIMRDYLQTTREYGIPAAQVRLYTTNILAEAANHEIFLNRLQIQTGVTPSLIDDGNMTRLVFQIAQRLLKKNPNLAQGRTFVTHIGPGNTRAMYFDHGRLAGYSNYRLGIFRAREAVAGSDELASQVMTHLEENIRGVVDHLADDFSAHKIDHHVAIGAEIQSVAPQIAKVRQGAYQLREGDLTRLTEKLARMNPDQLVRELHVHYTGGEGVVPALQTNLALAKRFGDESVWVPEGDFHFELMLDLMTSGSRTAVFQDEVMQSACEIGLRYKTDRKHADHVAGLGAAACSVSCSTCTGWIPPLSSCCAWPPRCMKWACSSARASITSTASTSCCTPRSSASARSDRVMVALLARYHRRYNPEPNHPHFSDLSREERMIVLKLAALLRLADALDRSHAQRIKSIQLRPEGSRLNVLTQGVDDTTVEQIAIDLEVRPLPRNLRL
jgi:exopolyphosphatase/guanosine-5'-triphosphate,3'-diphosphate pyrophosphatase